MTRVALIATMLLTALPARGDSLDWLGARLPNAPGEPWPWHLDARKPTPAGIPLDSVEQVFQQAFATWEEVSCAYIETAYAGRDAVSGPAQNDGINLMGTFIEQPHEDDELYETALGGGVAVAVALPLIQGDTILGCEIAFNAVDFAWSLNGDPGTFDLPTLAVHETGHCLGLDHHADDPTAVMHPFQSPGEIRRALAPHDVDNLCRIYPSEGEVGSPCPNESCPSPLSCTGTGARAYCTQGCEPDEADGCPVGFTCRASNAIPGASGVCVFGDEPAAEIGAPCTDGNDCGPGGLCFAYDGDRDVWRDGYCTADCSVERCPLGSRCYDDLGPSRYCLEDCRPGMDDCRPGYACEPLPGGGGRCRPACASDDACAGGSCRSCDGLCITPGLPGARIGDPCRSSEECPDGSFCRTDIGAGICTQVCGATCGGCPAGAVCGAWGVGERLCLAGCSQSADCPSSFDCREIHGVRACVPGCSVDSECPLGRICVEGACVLKPSPDAGCSDCDAGGEPRPDASVVPADEGPTEGCGCGSGGATFGATLPVLLMALRHRRGARQGVADE